MNMPQPQALLSVSGLSREFVTKRSLTGRAVSSIKAVHDVTFTIHSGETLAFVGESGCGKSTLGRLVLRLVEASHGKVIFDGVDIGDLKPEPLRAKRRQMQMIFQDPYAALNPRMTILQILSEPLKLHKICAPAQYEARVHELLHLVGLKPEQAQRYPHEFSGGQRQRIVIARALAMEPKLIVCDEAVSALDVSIRAQILNLLSDLQERMNVAYLFISHDLAVVKHIADRVAVMYLGSIVEMAPVDELFTAPRHPYTKALLAAIPVASPPDGTAKPVISGDVPSAFSLPMGCAFQSRCPYVIDRCKIERPVLTEIASGHSAACHRWSDLEATDRTARNDGRMSQNLEKLIAAFASDAIALNGATLA